VTALYLVRHGHAGDRSDFAGPDRRRPLSERGFRQAEALRDALAGCGATRLLSSPFKRCEQTLEPLAEKLGLGVELADELAEGAGGVAPLRCAEQLRHTTVVMCSHGDVIPDVLDELCRRGIELEDELRWQKGSAWVLEWDGDRLAKGRYLPPPRSARD